MSHNDKAAVLAGTSGPVVSNAVAARNYPTPLENTKDFAASFVAAKFGLSLCLARIVCELAQIGGRVA